MQQASYVVLPLQVANMAHYRALALALVLSFSSCYLSTPSSATSDGFLQCLSEKIPSELIFRPGSSNFTNVLVSTMRNPKFLANTTVRPICIVTVTDASHVQAAVRCGRMNDVRLRVRSGGHDYEGLSYRSERPEVFGMVDLGNMRAIAVSTDEGVPMAWVDSGATIGDGKVWGEKYFGANFQRLAAVKGMVDPTDYFRNEQSIPPLLQSY
ncbi:hypothetical protein EJB05_53258, partial [Eragrostis curvula]